MKILISGGGRCNLTTTKQGAELEAEYGQRRGRWLRHALRAFQPAHLVAMVEAAGVPLQEEDLDKIFPISGRSRDVLAAFLRLAEESGVRLATARVLAPARTGCALSHSGVNSGVETAPSMSEGMLRPRLCSRVGQTSTICCSGASRPAAMPCP